MLILINRRDALLREASGLRESAEKSTNAESRAALTELADRWVRLANEEPVVEAESIAPGCSTLVLKRARKLEI